MIIEVWNEGNEMKNEQLSQYCNIRKNYHKNCDNHCGICRKNFDGPFRSLLCQRESLKKVWIGLFTCVAVRAVLHLEVVGDMRTELFFMTLQRFIFRRNAPKENIIANATLFKATKMTIDKA